MKWTSNHTNPLRSFDVLLWRHNERDGVSNHQFHDCLLKRLFRRRSKKTSKLRVTGLCAENSPVDGELPAQMVSNAKNVPIWWLHHCESNPSVVVTKAMAHLCTATFNKSSSVCIFKSGIHNGILQYDSSQITSVACHAPGGWKQQNETFHGVICLLQTDKACHKETFKLGVSSN